MVRKIENVFKDNGSNITIVSFAGMGEKTPNHFLFEGYDQKIKANWFFLYDRSYSSYMNGHFHPTQRGVQGVLYRLKKLLRSNQRLVFVGHSCGGFAALVYASLLPVKRLLLFDPVTTVYGIEKGRGLLHNRGKEYVEQGGIYSNICPHLSKIEAVVRVYHSSDEYDLRQAALLKENGLIAEFFVVSGKHGDCVPTSTEGEHLARLKWLVSETREGEL